MSWTHSSQFLKTALADLAATMGGYYDILEITLNAVGEPVGLAYTFYPGQEDITDQEKLSTFQGRIPVFTNATAIVPIAGMKFVSARKIVLESVTSLLCSQGSVRKQVPQIQRRTPSHQAEGSQQLFRYLGVY